MAYYTDLFSPETYEAFSSSEQDITGFRIRQLNTAEKLLPGDKFLCYMTKLSRWIGVLQVKSDCFIDETPLFYEEDDPFVVRFKVQPIVWLPKELALPIREEHVWSQLSFTKEHDKTGSKWTGKLRSSMTRIDDEDGLFIEELLLHQIENGTNYSVDENKYRKFLAQRVRREDRVVDVFVPEETETDQPETIKQDTVRESLRIQALIAQLGEKMGYKIWLPKNDRSRIFKVWEPNEGTLFDRLPLNYDIATLKTIEQIDVLWLRKRAIARAFEVEHTTAIYSGILRMADLLALQPNMDIKLHIVAPYSKRDKVFQELKRPVFSLLDKGPLSELCSYLSYDSLEEIHNLRHLDHLSDTVLEEYEEVVE